MRRRAMGQETEYGSVCLRNGQAGDLSSIMLRFTRFVQGDSSHYGKSSDYRLNGHRVYLDVNDHIEVATAECDDPMELAHHVLAGDRNLAAAIVDFIEYRLNTWNDLVALTFYKNNICNYGEGLYEEETFGAHENYQVSGAVSSYVTPLSAFLATRQLVVGAGRWCCLAGAPPTFELAQRSAFINELSSQYTMVIRPLVNLRDEPHAEGSKRLHLICGDNNSLPQLTALKFGFMDALLAMIEEGRYRPLRLLNSVAAVRRVSQEPSARLDVIEHFSMTALDIQRHCLDQVWQFVDGDSELAPKRHWVEAWGRHLDRLAASYRPATRTYDSSDHLGELDWATKHVLVRAFMARARTATPAQVQRQELSLHDISSERSALQSILNRYGQFDELAVQRARTIAPLTTRAHARGQLVAHELVQVTDWQWFRVDGQSYRLNDPLNPTIPQVVQVRLSA